MQGGLLLCYLLLKLSVGRNRFSVRECDCSRLGVAMLVVEGLRPIWIDLEETERDNGVSWNRATSLFKGGCYVEQTEAWIDVFDVPLWLRSLVHLCCSLDDWTPRFC